MPCSMCDTISTEMSVPEALNAHSREVVAGLHRQLESFELRQQGRDRGRRLYLEAQDSSNGFVPALSAMAGLSTTPYLLYSMIGFDMLHVSWGSIRNESCTVLYSNDWSLSDFFYFLWYQPLT